MRLGVEPAAQASLFARSDYAGREHRPRRRGRPKSIVEGGSEAILGFGLTILIFVMILLYGNWVAMSVVEEKSRA